MGRVVERIGRLVRVQEARPPVGDDRRMSAPSVQPTAAVIRGAKRTARRRNGDVQTDLGHQPDPVRAKQGHASEAPAHAECLDGVGFVAGEAVSTGPDPLGDAQPGGSFQSLLGDAGRAERRGVSQPTLAGQLTNDLGHGFNSVRACVRACVRLARSESVDRHAPVEERVLPVASWPGTHVRLTQRDHPQP